MNKINHRHIKAIQSIGKTFNYLTVQKIIGSNKNRNMVVECLCVCGKKKKCTLYSLKIGDTKSCGCKKGKFSHIIIDKVSRRFYTVFNAMRSRVTNKNHKSYKIYGKRGIKLLWNNFESFHNDMYKSYLKHLSLHKNERTTIERIDVNKHYCKENCRWATDTEQGANRTNNRYLTINKQTKVFQTWCNEMNINRHKVTDRIDKLHWTPEEALGLTPRIRKPKKT